jgi:hypothetical protein
MHEMEELVSPFDESVRDPHPPAPRLRTLAGTRVTLLSISKPKSAEFLAELERVLVDSYGANVTQMQKPTFTAPAPAWVVDGVLKSSEAVIEALAD